MSVKMKSEGRVQFFKNVNFSVHSHLILKLIFEKWKWKWVENGLKMAIVNDPINLGFPKEAEVYPESEPNPGGKVFQEQPESSSKQVRW